MYSTRYSCQILMELKFSLQIFETYSNIKFYELFLAGGRTDMTKIRVDLRNFTIRL